jgi:uncharacterized membrane protein YfhO
MVRIVAQVSVNTPTASSGDRYKYRYGYGGGGGSWGRQQIVYKRPALDLGEKQPLSMNGINEEDGFNSYQSNMINSRIDALNEQTAYINTMITTHRDMRGKQETQQVRENCGNSDKEKEKAKEEEELKKTKIINPKLGKVIYRSRTGEQFVAQHSMQMTIVIEKRTGKSWKTQKIVWNDKVFETKEIWFSEMARLCVDRAEEKMKIVRCD